MEDQKKCHIREYIIENEENRVSEYMRMIEQLYDLNCILMEENKVIKQALEFYIGESVQQTSQTKTSQTTQKKR